MYLLLLLCVCAVTRAQDGPTVNTTQGVVMGTIEPEDYLAFYGIPYAGDPSGHNRFKTPMPAPKFSEVFHAVEKNVICAQPSSQGIIGVEDCLKLNIFTNNANSSKPVLVFIDGEDFSSSKIKPFSYTKLVFSDLVVVTLNFRLSIFGFLCLGVPGAPGNAGLKDVVQGLKWIKTNIAGFGGDPNNIVLMGHGSGAAMVDLITLSPLAAGLVNKAIALSGSGLAPWAVAYNPVAQANAVGDKLGYNGKNREELAKVLSTVEFNVLGRALKDFEFTNNIVLFGPCIENANLDPDNTFLSDAPINVLRSGKYNDIPYIAGYTSKEGTLRAEQASRWLKKMQANFVDFIPPDLDFESDENKKDTVNSIRKRYFPQKQINMEAIENFFDYIGDTNIVFPVIRQTRERALTSSSDIRIFEFAYEGTENSDWPYKQIPITGARHGAILNYLFDFDLKPIDVVVVVMIH